MKPLFLLLFSFSQLIAADTIVIYQCYGNRTHLIVKGRVLDPREFHEAKPDDNIFTNFRRMMGEIFNDERKNVSVTLKVGERVFTAKTDHEGYFSFEVTFADKPLQPHQKTELYLTKEPQVRSVCRAFILSDKKQVGIISDFDDTVVISDVTNKLRLVYHLLLKNYKQREAVAGMADRFKKILANSPDKPLFFITGSPRQFHSAIEKFLAYHHFPKHTLITKKVHGKNPSALFAQHDYKREQIEKLIELYPQIEWVLFGDSGEEDRQIYLKLAQKYPGHIRDIYIRDVKNGKIAHIFP